MIRHRYMLQCNVPNQHVFGTAVNVHTTRNNSMHKMWICTSLKPSISPYKCTAISDFHWLVPITVKLRPIKTKVNSSLKIAKLFQFQKLRRRSFPRFSMVVAHCYNGWNLITGILRNAWWTGLETSSACIWSSHTYYLYILFGICTHIKQFGNFIFRWII